MEKKGRPMKKKKPVLPVAPLNWAQPGAASAAKPPQDNKPLPRTVGRGR